MQVKNVDGRYLIRLDPGEKVMATLKEFCTEKNITAGKITGIGAANEVELAFFWPKTKKYESRTFTGDFEIAPLIGNIATKSGKVYLHCHITLGQEDYTTIAGHLNEAVISATGEIIIEPFVGNVERAFDDDIGLNLWQL